METQYQRGRREALAEIGMHFAKEADACQQRIVVAIETGRRARDKGDEALRASADKNMADALAAKIGHMKALSAVMDLERKDRA